MKKIKKQDFIFISIIFVFALISSFLIFTNTRNDDVIYVVVEANGYEYGRYLLSEEQTISINNTNILEIKDGDAVMLWASCPDQYCTGQGHLQTAILQMIVCLPNEVLVRLDGEFSTDLDGVS